MPIYLLLINALGFALMCIDTYKAKQNLWRIPEKTLFFVALLGGSLGCLLGMYAVRHKTKHARFVVGMPLIMGIQIVLLLFLLK